MSKQSVTQLTLKANEYLVKHTKQKSNKAFYMVGKEQWMNLADKGQEPDWKYSGIDFIDEFAAMSKREQSVVKFLKDQIKWDSQLECFNSLITLPADSPEFEMADIPYEVFLKGYQLLFKKDLVRRVSRGVYMFNPDFILPTGEVTYFKMKWSESKQHPDAPTYY